MTFLHLFHSVQCSLDFGKNRFEILLKNISILQKGIV